MPTLSTGIFSYLDEALYLSFECSTYCQGKRSPKDFLQFPALRGR